jgi:uncharacterized repeat protein (TIGR01451 family)
VLRARVLVRRPVLLPLAGVLALLASLMVVMGWSSPTARAANPGKPGFLAFTSSRNSELVGVTLTEEIPISVRRGAARAAALRPGTPERLTNRPGLDEQATGLFGEVVFVSTLEDPAGDLYVRDTKGNVRRLLASPGAESDPVLSHDGTWVAFVSARGGNPDIWVVRTKDGTDLRRVTVDGGVHSSPAWSPDGKQIAYSSTKDNPRGSLYAVDVDQPLTVKRLTTPASGSGDIEPTWAPDPDADDAGPPDRGVIAFTRVDGDSRAIYTMDPEGTPGKLKLDVTWADQPAWNYPGTLLAFRAGRNGGQGIFTADRLGGDLSSAVTGSDKRDPTFTGNLTVVATTDQFAGGSDIWALRANKTGLSGLTRTPEEEGRPAYSPDGRRIAYSVARSEAGSSIVVANADGTGATTITNTGGDSNINDSDPSWSPDSKRLVFGRVHNVERDDSMREERRLFIVADTGGELTEVKLPDSDAELGAEDPDWSVKDQIAYARTTHPFEGPPDSQLYVTDTAGKTHTQVTGTTDADRETVNWQPDWSPDGQALAFSRHLSSAQSVLATLHPVAPTGTVTQRTTPPPAPTPGGTPRTQRDSDPAYSPDGTQIAFTRMTWDGSSRSAVENIWLLTLDGGAAAPFTDDVPGDETAPTWQPATDLTLNKTGPKSADVNAPFTYTLTVTNNGAAAPGVRVTDELAQDVELVSAAPSQGTCDSGRPLVCSLGTLAAGATATVEVTVQTAKRGVVVNRATVDSGLAESDPSDNADIVRTPVRGTDLVVTAVDDPDPADVGKPLTYRIKVTRREGNGANDVVLTVPIPAGMKLVSAEAEEPDGTCTPPAAPADPLRCTWPLIGSEDDPDRNVTVVLKPTRPGPAVSTVEVTSATGELNAADNTARIETDVRGTDLTVGLAVTPDRAFVGHPVAVHAVVTNIGNGPADNARLELRLPPFACPAPVAGKCPANGTTVTLDLGRLGPGASAARDLTLAVTAAGAGTIRATALTASVDVVPGNNTVTRRLQASQPKVVLTPALGPPGFVTLARGTGFPPNTKVSLLWRSGITPNTAQVQVRADGTFAAQVIVVPRDQEGPRKLFVKGSGFGEVSADFLVVSGNVSPLGFVTRS